METVKKVATLAVAIVIGYFLYSYFMMPADEQYYEVEETDIPAYLLPSIPDSCSSDAQNFEKAIYGHGSHQASFAQRNRAHRKFESCLKESGFSDAEIRGIIEQLENKIKGYLIQDGY